jgi:hypothetical protein
MEPFKGLSIGLMSPCVYSGCLLQLFNKLRVTAISKKRVERDDVQFRSTYPLNSTLESIPEAPPDFLHANVARSRHKIVTVSVKGVYGSGK